MYGKHTNSILMGKSSVSSELTTMALISIFESLGLPTSLLVVTIFLFTLYRLLGSALRGYLLKRYTSVDGLSILGRKRDKKIQGTAVVCGGR